MGFDQYHEPPQELPEEAEAIGWYEQRLAVERDSEARAVMADAVGEEYKHFCMDLEFLIRRKPKWREIAEGVLFQEGSIAERGEAAEAAAGSSATTEGSRSASTKVPHSESRDVAGTLGIGSLKEG